MVGNRIPLKAGSIIRQPNEGRYIIEDLIAQGGLSLIYSARTQTNGYPVIIKEFFPAEHARRATKTLRSPDGTILERKGCVYPENDRYADRFYKSLKAFEQEGQLGSSAHNRSYQILSFADCGNGYALLPRWSQDSCSFMDLVDGWRDTPPKSVDPNFPDFGRLLFALTAINSLLAAVSSIHDQGILHLDLSSTNVVWGGNSRVFPEGTAFISDFGCAVLMSGGTYPADYVLSYSKDYAAPEYMIKNGQLDRSTDIYSCGRLLAFLCFGHRAFYRHMSFETLVEQMGVSDICKRGLLTILQKATAYDMHERYQYAREMQAAIQGLRSYIPLHMEANPDNVVFVNGYDLLQKMSALEIASCLVANDNALYSSEIQLHHGGDAELWAQHIEANPGNWGFILQTGTLNIVGNWSFCFVDAETETTIKTGDFFEESFSLSKRDDIFSERGTAVYLLNISVNVSHRSEKNRRLLWSKLAYRIFELSKDTLIKGIWGTVLREDQNKMYQEMGFRFVTECTGGGNVHYLSLTSEQKTRFTREYPAHEQNELMLGRMVSDIQVCRFGRKNPPMQKQMEKVSELLWRTDPYIYPAMMTLEEAKHLFPILFLSDKDEMFRFKNLYTAMLNDEVVGVALFCTGPLHWKSDYLRRMAEIQGITLKDSFSLAETQYFSAYDAVGSDETALINLCVDSKWNACPYRAACCKAKDPEQQKELVICWEMQNFRNASQERITSEEGKLLRVNRSIQAEGSFAQLKHNRGFDRFLTFGKQKALTALYILAISQNVLKYISKCNAQRCKTHILQPKELLKF